MSSMKELLMEIQKYRLNLINYGKIYAFENPDRLSEKEMTAVMAKIFDELNKIDQQFGQSYHETGTRLPEGISEIRQTQLFHEFIDWYQVINTPNQAIIKYVLKKYPVKECSRILCVGDGENSHLGRKLAMSGYQVVSVDPEARTEFTWPRNDKKGKFRAVRASFYDNSEDMINWAHLIVGNKIPPIVEDILKTDKPAVFSISGNPEIYRIRFRGVPITSEKQFMGEIRKCRGVKAIRSSISNGINEPYVFFEKEGRQKSINDDDGAR